MCAAAAQIRVTLAVGRGLRYSTIAVSYCLPFATSCATLLHLHHVSETPSTKFCTNRALLVFTSV